jgi:hypothetical protein
VLLGARRGDVEKIRKGVSTFLHQGRRAALVTGLTEFFTDIYNYQQEIRCARGSVHRADGGAPPNFRAERGGFPLLGMIIGHTW